MSRFPRPGRTPRPRPVPTAGPTPGPTPGPIPGTTFTLTTNIETVPVQGVLPANSTVTGTLAVGTANGQTFQTGDIINGGVNTTVSINALAPQANTVELNNVETLLVRNVGADQVAGVNDTNGILWTNLRNFSSAGSLNDVALINGSIATRYSLSNTLIDSGASLTVGFRAADIIGAADVAQFSISDVGRASVAGNAPSNLVINNNSTGATATGVERATVATSGVNNVNIAFGTNTTTFSATGNGTNRFNIAAGGLTALSKVVNLGATSGTNDLRLGTFVTAGDTYQGGTGVDTLRITPANLGAVGLAVSGFENLNLTSGAANGVLGFTSNANFGEVRLSGLANGNAAATVTLLNAGTLPRVVFEGDGAAAEREFNGLTAATTGTVGISFRNIDANGAGVATTYDLGQPLTFDGATTVSLSIDNTGSAANNLLDDRVNSTALSSFTASGSGALGTLAAPFEVNGSGGVAQNLQVVNLGSLAGTAQSGVEIINNSFIGLNVTAAPGGTAVVTAAETNTDVLNITGGSGVDQLTAANGTASVYTGFVTANLGAGNDIVRAAVANVVVANGGDGNDFLLSGAAVDTLRGDAGNDTANGGAGADTLAGGGGNNRFVFANFATRDRITDFVAANDALFADVAITAATKTNGLGAKQTKNATTIAGAFTKTGKLRVITNAVKSAVSGKVAIGTTNAPAAAFAANQLRVFADLAAAKAFLGGTAQDFNIKNVKSAIYAARTSAANGLFLFGLADAKTATAKAGTGIAFTRALATVGAAFTNANIFLI